MSRAERIRRQWMEMMGMDSREIDHHCKADPPMDWLEELRQLIATRINLRTGAIQKR